MRLNCKYSDFTNIERAAFRLSGEKVDFECLHPKKYYPYSYPGFKKASQRINNPCKHYETCEL